MNHEGAWSAEQQRDSWHRHWVLTQSMLNEARNTIDSLTAQRDAAEKDRDDWRTKALAEHGTHSPPLAARLRAAEKACEAAEEWYDPECCYLPRSVVAPLTEWRRTKEGA